ncbi:MAG: BolA/IbaG family iron-sulfur metabolism protein [Deltaproteobacteria bacterium]|nr:BolA/IbaG family iron-sulfur metabolism protein [Deltaproteobacteria bacterium]
MHAQGMPDAHDALREAIVRAMPDARVTVTGAVGHYTLTVLSGAFEGRSMLESHRLVYAAIAPLMKGDDAPVHAIDSLTTRTA